jgi:replicative DNA helicase
MQSCGRLAELPIYIDDTPGLTVMQLRAKARRLKKRRDTDIGAIVIDYLQLMSAPEAQREGRQQEVSLMSRQVKALARELDVPVVCLAQLNRGAEQREGHRPRMADLRESGSIEQDADVIVLLHREEYYHRDKPEWAANHPEKVGLAELIIAKQRNGPTGVVELKWDASITRFVETTGGGHTATPPRGHTETKPAGAHASSFAGRTPSGPVDDFRDGGGDNTRIEQPDDDMPF